jgi:hypothetical protein
MRELWDYFSISEDRYHSIEARGSDDEPKKILRLIECPPFDDSYYTGTAGFARFSKIMDGQNARRKDASCINSSTMFTKSILRENFARKTN